MPPYKNQHYLPAVYLKNFSVDQDDIHRKSKIWRIGSESQMLVTADSQCRADYHYSSDEAQEVESLFGQIETLYNSCKTKIRDDTDPTGEEFFGLILMLFDLHLRNPNYENQTEENNFHIYKKLWNGFMSDLFLAEPGEEPSVEKVFHHLRKFWRGAGILNKGKYDTHYLG
jgi:hypothetical protein